ncbi:sulfite exporter TauE/SafE family protein [Sphingobacterium sp. CZ-2]|uniref:sulfite exporter TauE/SafE family protein n=1 Tax=Sphingobacterium sp. CZ-2 TaxID=2557994 RepID=UPI00106F0BC4|nr:sulfite exporter TauE/SafE family protein [Sphingobacterium sp. CZ-2]QBR12890.1 sulfite exporter TauE/SafE family protein [Sphingobacterium sp. CZ-2]
MEKYLIFLILALITEIIGTVSGFGSSILFVPTASLFFDFKAVLGITAVFHVFSNISKITLFRKGINKDIAIKLGIPAVLFVIIGALLTKYVPVKEMELGMNILIAALAIFLLFRFNKPLAQTNKNLYLGGMISGFFAGLVGTGGAIRGITLAAFNLPKDIFIATSSLIDLGVDFSRAIIYVSQGYFPKEYIVLIPFLIIVSILGSYLGKLILKRTSERVFKYIVLGIILLTSVFQFINYFLSPIWSAG